MNEIDKMNGMVKLSQRIQNVPASPIRKWVPLADAAKMRGIKIIHLNIGDPDMVIPKVMTERLKVWEGGIPYAHSQGDSELLGALEGYYHRLGYKYINKANIQVSVGGSEALAMAMAACCESGDEVVVFEPFFVGYASLAPVYNVTLKPIRTKLETGFHLPPRAEIEAQISDKTKAILFTNPNNPTGTVFTRAEVEILIDIAHQRNLWLWADEVYREFVFDGLEGVSLLKYMPEMPDQLIVLDSLSKRYSAPGLRLGMFVSLNEELMAGVLRMAMGRLSAGFIDQKVAAQLVQVSHEEILAVRNEYQRRRDVVYAGLSKIPGLSIHKPEGAFYCVVGLPVPDAEAFCKFLLTDFDDNGETVMLTPMSGFYATPGIGGNEVRVAFVVGVERLQRAVEILAKTFVEFSH